MKFYDFVGNIGDVYYRLVFNGVLWTLRHPGAHFWGAQIWGK